MSRYSVVGLNDSGRTIEWSPDCETLLGLATITRNFRLLQRRAKRQDNCMPAKCQILDTQNEERLDA